MKIVHLILSKGFAGTERYVCDLANYQKNNNKVYIVKLKSDNTEYFKKNTSKAINFIEMSNFFKSIFLKKIIKKIQPDIVHTHLGDAAKIIKKKWGQYKTVATMHMNYNPKYFKNIDGIICSNNHQLQNIKKKFSGSLFKSYLWPIENVKKNKINLKKKLGIPADYYIFGSIGRFHRQKGFDFLASTFDKVNLKKTALVLVGNGHLDFIKKYKHNKNIFLLDHSECPSHLYQIFDAAVFVSRWESFGITLLEAMQHRLPIISTVHEGNKDWVNKFKILKIKVDNFKNLKKSLLYFRKLKPKKISYDLKDFKYKTLCQKIQKFYQDL